MANNYFDLHIYPRRVYVVCGDFGILKENFINRDYTPFNIKHREDALAMIANIINKVDNKIGYVVWFPNSNPDSDGIVHEAVHIAMEAFKDVGAYIDDDNQEPFTYLVQYLYKNIVTILDSYDTRSTTRRSCKTTKRT